MQIRLAGIACAILVWAAPCAADPDTTGVAPPSAIPSTSAATDPAAADTGIVALPEESAASGADSAAASAAGSAASPASAGFGASDLLPGDTDVPDGFSLMARTALSLGVVLLVIWGALVLLRRTTGSGGGSRASHIQVLDRTYLAPKRAVYVVQVGRRTLALGVTDSTISQLADLEEGDFPRAPESSNGGNLRFASVLDGARRAFGRSPGAPDTDRSLSRGASS